MSPDSGSQLSHLPPGYHQDPLAFLPIGSSIKQPGFGGSRCASQCAPVLKAVKEVTAYGLPRFDFNGNDLYAPVHQNIDLVLIVNSIAN